MKTEHEYAQVLRWIADGETDLQINPIRGDERWEDVTPTGILDALVRGFIKPDQIRIKPRTILINGIEVPEPLRVKLSALDHYWLADPTAQDRTHQFIWMASDVQMMWLTHGLVHATEEAARAHVDALLSFTEVKE